jgi:tRNA A37 threonylcarbamoyladenosine biosynthesis protein TsaE
MNEYQTSEKDTVFHFDFYRITDKEEALVSLDKEKNHGIKTHIFSN